MATNIVKENQQVIDILSAHVGVVSVNIDEDGVRVETTKKLPINIDVNNGIHFTFLGKSTGEFGIMKCGEIYYAIYEGYEGLIEPSVIPLDGEVVIRLCAYAPEVSSDDFTKMFDFIVDLYMDCLCFVYSMLNDEQSITIDDDNCCDN